METLQSYTCAYALVLASATVPLSLVSFLAASSDFFCAAICHAGMAARPPASLPYDEDADLSAVGVGMDVGADAVLVPWLSVVLVPLVCSACAGVAEGCCAGVDEPELPLTFDVGAELCDWLWF
jgi:hypothetical protein